MFHVLLIKILEFLFYTFRAIIALLSSIIICLFNNFLILPRALKYLDPVEGSYGLKWCSNTTAVRFAEEVNENEG